jgi:hypothetical protein
MIPWDGNAVARAGALARIFALILAVNARNVTVKDNAKATLQKQVGNPPLPRHPLFRLNQAGDRAERVSP